MVHSHSLLLVALSSLFGLVTGSFLNVVVYRVPRHLSVNHPRSLCPRCSTPLRTYDNIPLVSWVVLRARCRQCGEPIPARYPLVEALTAVAFGLTAWVVGPGALLVPLLVLNACVICATAIDLDGFAVPWAVAGPAAAAALSLVAVSLVDGDPGRLAWGAGGALAGAVVWVLLAGRGQRTPERPERRGGAVALSASLGGVAGWLWAPAALVCPAWLVLAGGLGLLGVLGPDRRVRLWSAAPGALVVVVVAAALGTG